MIRRALTLAAIVSLLLSPVAGLAWCATSRVTFEDRTMPGPGLFILDSHPWLGWLCIGLFASGVGLLPVRKMFSTVIEERRRHGRCLHCGYDLRASEGICPECGTEVAQSVE